MALWAFSIIAGLVTISCVRRLLKHRRKCPSQAMMFGQTIIITGANSGIGRAAALELARRKARVILACRTLQSAKDTAKSLQVASGNNDILARECNLASLSSVRAFCSQILVDCTNINVLINNAGVFQCPYSKTEDGFEMQMGVNHLGHFLLTWLLLDRIKASGHSRIVIVSSALSKRGKIKFDDINSEKSYDKFQAYADSKLANLLFARHLNRKLKSTEPPSLCNVYALHPGMVITNLGRHVASNLVLKLFGTLAYTLGMRDAEEGCQALVYCSVAEELREKSGIYIDKNCTQCPFPPNALDVTAELNLWRLSKQLVGLTEQNM